VLSVSKNRSAISKPRDAALTVLDSCCYAIGLTQALVAFLLASIGRGP
jgi:hypothetical protein